MSDVLLPIDYEPLKKNRWIMRFPSELGIQEWQLLSGARPSIEQNEVELPFLNTSIYTLGRFTWNTLDVTLRDFIGPSTSQAVIEWLREHSESISGRQGYMAGYKKDIFLEMLDPAMVVIEKWLLNQTMMTNVDWGSLSMDDDGIADITMTLRFDRAIFLF